jgi:hypothetical protein
MFHSELVGEREKLMARAQELGMGYVDLDRVTFADDLKALVPADVLTRHQVLPVKRERTNIWLACSDPKNMDAIDEIKALTGCRVIPVFAQPEALREAIDALASFVAVETNCLNQSVRGYATAGNIDAGIYHAK